MWIRAFTGKLTFLLGFVNRFAEVVAEFDWCAESSIGMKLSECYGILGLRAGASMQEVKTAYRRLARLYHPDANPGDRRAQERFIQVSTAYKMLLNPERSPGHSTPSPPQPEAYDPWPEIQPVVPAPSVRRPIATLMASRRPAQPPIQHSPQLTQPEYQLKVRAYQELRQLLQERRFPKAVQLVNAMAQRFRGDGEVQQWQAIAYHLWGRRLIQLRQLNLAKAYLIRSAQLDPNNLQLRQAIERDLVALQTLTASVNSRGF